MKNNKQSDRFQLTINNPSEHGMTHDEIKKILIQKFKTLQFFCMADEEGSCYHIHIFVCFTSRVRFSTVKRNFPMAHIEATKGLVSDNIAYIKKSGKWKDTEKSETKIDGTYEEAGDPPPDSKGRRADMTELYNMVKDGMTNAEILAQNQDYILQIDKIDKLRTILLTEHFKNTRRLDIHIIYISGETGTNKTRSILDKHGDANVYRVTDYQHPFDGYNCQPVIAFDEFRSSLSLKDMLHYCDIYSIQLPARYSNRFACYDTVYIVSNWSLERQYSELQKNDRASWVAFLRRIKEVRIHNKDKTVTVYNSIEDYLNRNQKFHKPTKEENSENPFVESEVPEQLELPM